MSLHKTLLATSILASTLSFSALAHDHNKDETKQTWLGVFAGKYAGDSMRPDDQAIYNGGHMAGAELGFRFSPEWAVRLEATRTFIGTENGDIDGFNFGVDGMYFWDQDNKYVFFGGRQIDDSLDSTFSAAAGIGAQWGGASAFRFITEAGYYRDFENKYNDFVLKLGLSYQFGETVSGTGSRKAMDSDKDGVMDGADKCPNTPMGSTVDASGCDNDSDKDGVINSLDNCPTTAMGVRVDSKGCALADDDKDGVLNINDACPNTSAGVAVDTKGCAKKAMIDKTVRLDALFDNNSAFVKNPNSAEFVKFAAFMNANPNAQAVIEGHTSVVGSAEYNQSLSERRAANVREVLVEVHGAPGDRMDLIGYGESRPLNTALTPEAHAQNRRVVAVVTARVEQ